MRRPHPPESAPGGPGCSPRRTGPRSPPSCPAAPQAAGRPRGAARRTCGRRSSAASPPCGGEDAVRRGGRQLRRAQPGPSEPGGMGASAENRGSLRPGMAGAAAGAVALGAPRAWQLRGSRLVPCQLPGAENSAESNRQSLMSG